MGEFGHSTGDDGDGSGGGGCGMLVSLYIRIYCGRAYINGDLLIVMAMASWKYPVKVTALQTNVNNANDHEEKKK